MRLEIHEAKKIWSELSEFILKTWKKEFWWGKINETSLFFIVYHENTILALWSLTPVELRFMGKTHDFYGIGWIVALKKWKWYGKILLSYMTDFLSEKNKIWIGVCKRKNSWFYEKCGLLVYLDLVSHLQRKTNTWDYEWQPDWDVDILVSLENPLIKAILQNPKEKVTVPFWW